MAIPLDILPIRYDIFPIKFIINENINKFCLMDLIDRMAVNPDIQLMLKFLSNSYILWSTVSKAFEKSKNMPIT